MEEEALGVVLATARASLLLAEVQEKREPSC